MTRSREPDDAGPKPRGPIGRSLDREPPPSYPTVGWDLPLAAARRLREHLRAVRDRKTHPAPGDPDGGGSPSPGPPLPAPPAADGAPIDGVTRCTDPPSSSGSSDVFAETLPDRADDENSSGATPADDGRDAE